MNCKPSKARDSSHGKQIGDQLRAVRRGPARREDNLEAGETISVLERSLISPGCPEQWWTLSESYRIPSVGLRIPRKARDVLAVDGGERGATRGRGRGAMHKRQKNHSGHVTGGATWRRTDEAISCSVTGVKSGDAESMAGVRWASHENVTRPASACRRDGVALVEGNGESARTRAIRGRHAVSIDVFYVGGIFGPRSRFASDYESEARTFRQRLDIVQAMNIEVAGAVEAAVTVSSERFKHLAHAQVRVRF
ncbi:hypothetical protein JHW43_003877 [Diplocarpon mali]|nr:hypothetical protein JHW43_003877 [Diplocarpon mali]